MGMLRQILFLLFLLSSQSFNSIDKSVLKHIKDIHYPNAYPKTKLIRNEENGIESSIYGANSPKSILGKRKIFFPDDPDFKVNLNGLIKNVPTLFENKPKKRSIVEYKKDNEHGYMVGVIKKMTGEVKTIYPLLRYISLQEFENKKISDVIYMASIWDEVNNKWIKKFKTIQEIQQAAITGRCLAYHVEKEKLALVDISKDIGADIFGKKGSRNSIVVESSTWTNKNLTDEEE